MKEDYPPVFKQNLVWPVPLATTTLHDVVKYGGIWFSISARNVVSSFEFVDIEINNGF